ncbi:MAG: response regulator, partial [Gammaproteobacteria bacterium]
MLAVNSDYAVTTSVFMSHSARILIVDDEADLREMVAEYLVENGFQVITASDAAYAREIMRTQSADLAVVDVRMPGEDGLSLARYLREHHDLAIVMLTAAAEVVDRIVGLEIGADDYVSKPFDPRELLARLKAILRRRNR